MYDIGRQVGVAGILLTVSLSLNQTPAAPSQRTWSRAFRAAGAGIQEGGVFEPVVVRHAFQGASAPARSRPAVSGHAVDLLTRSVPPDTEDVPLSESLTSAGLFARLEEHVSSPAAVGVLEEFLAMDEEVFEIDPADIDIPELTEDTGHAGSVFTMRTVTVRAGDTPAAVAAREGVDADHFALINGLGATERLRQGRSMVLPRGMGMVHVVDKKESVFTLAARYNLKPSTILFLNRAKHEGMTLRRGERIFIPLGVIATEASRSMAADPTVKNLLENKLSLAWPVHGRLSSRYGWRTDPFLECSRFHRGIDIACRYGTPVRAAERGRVVWAGWRGAAGIAVIIEHSNRVHSLYGHCSRLLVKRGQWVSRRQPIARVGSTGRATGSHLHFSIKRAGKVVNPLKELNLASL